jgi:hypothetical protein
MTTHSKECQQIKNKKEVFLIFNLLALLALPALSLMPARAAGVAISPLNAVKVYPNPWRADKHQNVSLKFEGVPAGSVIKLFTIAAQEVKVLAADASGSASWDRTNTSGERVASGVYIYLIIDPQGNETSGKLAVIQ